MAHDGTVSAGSSATLLCQPSPVLMLRNTGTVAVGIGGPGVTTGNAVVTLPANMPEPVFLDAAALGLLSHPVYAISGTAGQSVVFHSHAYGA
jgi:hypothetical protein